MQHICKLSHLICYQSRFSRGRIFFRTNILWIGDEDEIGAGGVDAEGGGDGFV